MGLDGEGGCVGQGRGGNLKSQRHGARFEAQNPSNGMS